MNLQPLPMAEKAECRQRMREKLRNMTPAERSAGSRRVAEFVMNQPWFKEAAVIGAYCALRFELPLESVMQRAWADGRKVAVPVRTGGESVYHWSLIFQETEWEQGPDGVPQPSLGALLDPGALDLVFVPGLAFAKNGVRLGRGGGHYDRLLAAISGLKVGVAMDWQVVGELPQELHDVRMDLVVTDQATYGDSGNKEE